MFACLLEEPRQNQRRSLTFVCCCLVWCIFLAGGGRPAVEVEEMQEERVQAVVRYR